MRKKTVKPPFKNLQSFNCTAIILSYYDFRIEVRALMKSLSANSKAYYVKHRAILTGHLIPFLKKSPIFNEVLLAGYNKEGKIIDFEYPTREDIASFKVKGVEARVDEL